MERKPGQTQGLPVERGEHTVLPLDRQVQVAIGSIVLAVVLLSQFVNHSWIWLPGPGLRAHLRGNLHAPDGDGPDAVESGVSSKAAVLQPEPECGIILVI